MGQRQSHRAPHGVASGPSSSVEPIPEEGVSLRFVLDFARQHKWRLRGLTTSEVCAKFVMPATRERACSYASLLKAKGRTEGLVGRANVFVSHAWRYLFLDLVEALREQWEREGSNPETYLWLDVFVNNQHGTGERPFEWWTTAFTSSLSSIGRAWVVLIPWDDPIYVQRIWCLFELYTIELQTIQREIIFPARERRRFLRYLVTDFNAVSGVLERISHIDIEKATAFKLSDQEAILRLVQQTVGFSRLNATIFAALKRWFATAAESALGDSDAGISAKEKDKLILRVGTVLLDEHPEKSKQLFLGLIAKLDAEAASAKKNELLPSVLVNLSTILIRQNNFEEAEKCFSRAMQIIEEQGDDLSLLIPTLINYTALYIEAGKHEHAETIALRTLKLAEGATKWLPAESLSLLYSHLGNIKSAQRDFPQAEIYFRHSLALIEEKLGATHPMVASALILLSDLCVVLKKLDEAEILLTRSLQIREKVYGKNDFEVAMCLCSIAFLFEHRGDVDRQMQTLQRVASVQDANPQSSHKVVSAGLDKLSRSLCERRQYEQALLLAQRTLERTTYHDLVLNLRLTIADSLYGLGRLDEAEREYHSFLELYQTEADKMEHHEQPKPEEQDLQQHATLTVPTDPERGFAEIRLLGALENLVHIKMRKEHEWEAEPLLLRQLQLIRKYSGESWGTFKPLLLLGAAYNAQHKAAQAEETLLQASKLLESLGTENEPSSGFQQQVELGLVKCYVLQRRFDEARLLVEKNIGEYSETTVQLKDVPLLYYLGNLWFEQGHLEEAERHYLRAIRLCEPLVEQEKWVSEGLAGSLVGLASVLRLQKRLDEAEVALRRALALIEKTQRTVVARCCLSLGRLLSERGDPETALPLLNRALTIAKSTKRQRLIAEVSQCLGEALAVLGMEQEGKQCLQQALAAFSELGIDPECQRVQESLERLGGVQT
eukprot:TRINITY_DN7209_c0_g1_i5.p1 TRINITY_DN7209_c0_g1~~TRINITY_DN7209_c0_g1_i5.p1  ORF type:complete len:1114 (+),score=222.94 TRINITY_DN7209_c0_g1_i5:499-3342(+)